MDSAVKTAPKKANTGTKKKAKELPKLPPIKCHRMKEGDLIIGYFNPKTQIMFELKPGKRQDTKYGHYDHDNIIGQPYSSKVTRFS